MRTSQLMQVGVGMVLMAGPPQGAQAQPASASLPHIRTIERVLATSPVLRGPVDMRQLSDGRVMVNDGAARQVLLFDSLLSHPRVLLDSAGPPDRRYGTSGSLIAYHGDSTLFLDRSSMAFLLLDPSGAIVRTMSGPTGRGGGSVGAARLDAQGRVVFTQSGGRGVPAPTPDTPPMTINYSYVLGFDLATRKLDTAVVLRQDTTRRTAGVPAPPGPGGAAASIFPVTDAWALMADGTIAVVRGQDYHIDWFGADGKHTPSPKVAHEWTRLSESDKQRLADSLTTVRDTANKTMLATMTANGRTGGTPMYDAAGRVIGMMFTASVGAGADGPPPPPRPTPPTPFQATVPIPPDLLPDYFPAFTGRALADADNHLWVMLPETMVSRTEPAYDIIDRKGVLIDRVRPPGTSIIGFGPGGIVYVVKRDAGQATVLKVKIGP